MSCLIVFFGGEERGVGRGERAEVSANRLPALFPIWKRV